MQRRTDQRETTTRSPFGALLSELRAVAVSTPARSGASGAPARRASATGPEPDLWLETRVVSDLRPSGPLAVRWLLPVSLFVHATLAFGAIFGPLLRADALPTAAPAARAFFVTPAMFAPPPPPPAPPAPAAAGSSLRRPSPRAAEPQRLIAAVEAPPTVLPEATDLDVRAAERGADTDAEAGGEPGGVAGGVPGGVVGGVVGGIPAAAVPIAPLRVGGEIKEPTKLKHVPPVYPDIAVRANVHGNVILECLVSPMGRVTSVTVVKGIPLLDKAAMEAVKQWVYMPTLKDGVPLPVILTVTVRFGLKSAGAALGPVLPAA